ncbi:MAG: type III-B CRISPR module-associated Cmr3 family protein [Streptosporangiaceae bacterium]
MTSTRWLALRPRDTVFVRDGRAFDAAADTTAQAVRPGPSTIAGAVGAALGAEPREVRGPVLGWQIGDEWETYFPVPANLVIRAGIPTPTVHRLILREASGRTDLDDLYAERTGDISQRWLMPPEDAGRVDPLHGWLPGRVLARYLAGDLPFRGGTPREKLAIEEDPLLPEPRVGLARDDSRQVRTGYLYQAAHLRAKENWGFLAQCEFDDGAERQPSGPVQLGGRGRLADIELAQQAAWPAHPDGAVGRRVLVYLATPALWRTGWRIPLEEKGAELVAAATGEPEPVATVRPGTDWADSRVLRWAAPAGSVYLLEFGSDEEGAAWAWKVHGTAYAGPDDDDRLRTAGFGVVLTGAW